MIDELEIKICEEKDIDALEKVIPSPGTSNFHKKRFESQKQGKNIYLIVWLNDKPIGHLDLRFHCPAGTEKYLTGCAEINAAAVIPEFQSKGIGAKLIKYAEDLAKEKGYKKICLGVASDNTRARQLYTRLGYADWGQGIISASWSETNEEGKAKTKTEETMYMQKQLS